MEGIFLDLGAESSSKFFALFPRFPFISKVGKDPWDTRGGKGPIWGGGLVIHEKINRVLLQGYKPLIMSYPMSTKTCKYGLISENTLK